MHASTGQVIAVARNFLTWYPGMGVGVRESSSGGFQVDPVSRLTAHLLRVAVSIPPCLGSAALEEGSSEEG